nr:hypothetical protein [uncultured bacterium]
MWVSTSPSSLRGKNPPQVIRWSSYLRAGLRGGKVCCFLFELLRSTPKKLQIRNYASWETGLSRIA